MTLRAGRLSQTPLQPAPRLPLPPRNFALLSPLPAFPTCAALACGVLLSASNAPAQTFQTAPPAGLQKRPESVPVYPRPLAPLLPPSGSPVTAPPSPADWNTKRETLRLEWQSFLGAFPSTKAALAAEFHEKEEQPGFTRQRVTYQLEDGLRTDAMVLLPRNATAPLPAILLLHPTYDGHYRRVAGLEGTEEPERQQAVQLVEAGYAVVTPRCFLWEEIPPGYHQPKTENAYAARVRHMRERHPDWKGITRMTWDGIRALDFTESLPQVDPSRIGLFGHSLGAKEVLYLAAFDPRPTCVVFSEGGLGMRQSNWDAVWYLGPEIRQPGFQREHHELVALIAPRPFLLLAGSIGKEAADSDASWLLLDAARPVYEILGAGKNLAWLNHGLGHRYGAVARPVAEAFFAMHLKERSTPR